MSLTSTRSRNRSPVYYFKIEGLPCLYGTLKPPALTVGVGVPGNFVEYERRASVVPFEGFDFSRRLIAEDAIIEAETCVIRLAGGGDPGDAWDPVQVFGRLGRLGSEASCKLRDDIPPAAGDITVEVSTVAGFAAGDVVHIGREACYVDQTLDLPPRLSLKREVLGTRRQAHRVDASAGIFPAITKPLVYFRGRRVTVYESSTLPGGQEPDALSYIERFKGVIVAEPQISTQGRAHSVEIEIAPVTSLLDQPLGSGEPVLRLSDRAHTFDGVTVNHMDIVEVVKEERQLLNLHLCQEDAEGFVFLPFNPADDASSLFGSVGSNDNSLPANHPRRTPLNISGQYAIVTGFNNNVVKTSPVINNPNGNNLFVSSSAASERRRLTMSSAAGQPVTLSWPSALVEKISTSFGSESMNGVAGGRARLALDLTSEVSPALTVSANFSWIDSQPNPPKVEVLLSNDLSELVDASILGLGDHRRAHIFDADGVSPEGRRNLQHSMIPEGVLSLSDGEDVNTVELLSELQHREIPPVYVGTKIASAFVYLGHFSESQGGFIRPEMFITLESDPGIQPGASRTYEFTEDSEDTPRARVTLGPATAVAVDGVTVYRCNILDSEVFGESSLVADYEGESRHRLRPVAAFTNQPIGVVILQLLCSLNGEGVTSADYDVLPIGAGIDEADIDVGSFLAIPEPLPGAAALRPVARQDSSIYESVRGLLRASGYAIDMRVDEDGVCRVAATPFGIPNAAAVLDAITESDISDSPTPASSAEVTLRNVFNFRSNFDSSGEALLEKTVRDTASIEAFGESSEIDIDLTGAELSDDTPGQIIEVLRPLFSRLRMEFSEPRRVFSFSVRAGLAAQLKIGGTYAVTHRHLLGVDGQGVESALCRLRSVSFSGFDTVADCEFVFYGFTGAGWGPSADVDVIAGNVLTLSDASYSAGDDKDIDAFIYPGAKLRLYPKHDLDTFAVVTVSTFDKAAKQITLQEASVHPIDEPAYLTATIYGDSPPELQVFGYFDRIRVT